VSVALRHVSNTSPDVSHRASQKFIYNEEATVEIISRKKEFSRLHVYIF
jgi:hypothetical protein